MTTEDAGPVDDVAAALASIRTESGTTLLVLAEESPVLLVFLRHFGCSFCRRTISEIAELGPELARRGVRPVFVHMGPVEIANAHFDYYGIGDVERVCDPKAAAYGLPMFGLGRKRVVAQMLNPVVWWGWLNGTVFRHGIGMIQGDADRMPGLFLLQGPKVVRRYVYKTIADEPDYLAMVR